MTDLWYGYSDAHFASRYTDRPIHLMAQAPGSPEPRRGLNTQSLCGAWISYGVQGRYVAGVERGRAALCKKCQRAAAKRAAA
jgi:hypothetical protein